MSRGPVAPLAPRLFPGACQDRDFCHTAGERRAGYTALVASVGNIRFTTQTILAEEIFGPVAPVVAFNTDDEAVQMANNTAFGLVAYVYTSDLARGLAISERLESGMVGLNRGLVSDPAAPFGGFKQSGLGREGGHEGMLEFTESQYIAVSW
jgi:acyl-CoA reductase-like NAD-dependent aldehyde dehydrogenase